jgi:uncharacterized protein
MPAVISNTSPLQYLYQADMLFLLPALFDRIYVPEAVVSEIKSGQKLGVSLPDVLDVPWIEIRPLQQPALLPLVTHLGDGEKEVLALGLEIPGSLLLLDDRDARRHANFLSLNISGTVGVLLLAKERGLIESIRPILERFDVLRFRLNPTTRKTILRLAEE